MSAASPVFRVTVHSVRSLPVFLFCAVLALLGCQGPIEVEAQDATSETGATPVAERLAELGVELPEPGTPVANYVRAVTTGNLVFLAGHIPRGADGEVITGKLGDGLTTEQGYEAAKQSAIALLGSLEARDR